MQVKRFFVTGATGYVGKNLCRILEKQGLEIIRLSRKNLNADENFFPYSLGGALTDIKFDKNDVLIHTAWDYSIKANKKKMNLTGTAELFKYAEENGVAKIIFISSLAAHSKARCSYGKQKLAIEQQHPQIISLRPGMIFGGSPQGGIFAFINSFLEKFYFFPMICGNAKLHPCHIDDLTELIVKLSFSDQKEGLIVAANPDPTLYKQLVKILIEKLGKKRLIIPLPARPFLMVTKFFEYFNITIPLKSDSILGSLYQNDRFEEIPKNNLGVAFRGFNDGK